MNSSILPSGFARYGKSSYRNKHGAALSKRNSANLSRSRETCFFFHFNLLFSVFSMGIINSSNSTNIPDEVEGDTALIDFAVK